MRRVLGGLEGDAQRMKGFLVVQIIAFATFGGLLGFAYLAALGLNVRLYFEAGTGWLALLIHTTRLLATGVALTLCARQGALPLLSSVAGFQIMKTIAINQRMIRQETTT